MPSPVRFVRWLWGEITAPPHIKPIMAVAYGVATFTGLATLTNPPQSIAGEVGPVLAAVWAWSFIAGGVLGLATVFTPWWWAERTALIFAGTGVAVYAFVVLNLHILAPPGSSRLTQVGIIGLAVCLLVLRWHLIRVYSYQPLSRER